MAPAAWHPDPTGRHELRWWDGTVWTDHVSDHGVAGWDALAGPAPVPSIPTLTPSPAPAPAPSPTLAPNSPSRWLIWVAVGVVAAVGIVGGVVMTMRGSDSGTTSGGHTENTSSDDGTGHERTDPSTGTAVAVTIPPTAAPATTGAEVTLPPTASTTVAPATAAPTTVAPVTTLHTATVAELAAALPLDTELPSGWTPSGDSANTSPAPSSAVDVWFCGGPDDVTRAQTAGAVAMVWGPPIWTLPDGWAGVDLYAFPSESAAAAFMAASLATASACPTGWSYTMPEGDGVGEFDGFSEDYGADAVWSFVDTVTATPGAPAGPAEAFTAVLSSRWSTTYDGWDYGGTTTAAVQYERTGRVVIVVYSGGDCCLTGFEGVDPSLDTAPTAADVGAAADMLRPGLVARLGTAGVL